jgi:hypothetical protein
MLFLRVRKPSSPVLCLPVLHPAGLCGGAVRYLRDERTRPWPRLIEAPDTPQDQLNVHVSGWETGLT